MTKVISYLKNLIRRNVVQKTGMVKWFNTSKGYGFIEPSDKSRDVFLHISALNEAGISDIRDNQAVSFETEEFKGKISAINIKLI
jgi:CspA family cold shock protein